MLLIIDLIGLLPPSLKDVSEIELGEHGVKGILRIKVLSQVLFIVIF